MAKSKSPITIERHIIIANRLAHIAHELDEIQAMIEQDYPKSHPIRREFKKLAHADYRSNFTQLKGHLDTEWHKSITDEQFREHGHIYYNLSKRYEEITKAQGDSNA